MFRKQTALDIRVSHGQACRIRAAVRGVFSAMRVLVCGGRDFQDYRLVSEILDDLFPPVTGAWLPPPSTAIIHGGARGTDSLASLWAYLNDVEEKVFWPDWKAHGKAAGPIRNQRMLDEGKPDLVIAFPGDRGTADMVKRARKAGIEVMEVEG